MVHARGIDHLVLCVADLDGAERFYRRLGFTTTPRAIHPFGTGNNLIQLQGNYIELLGVVAPEKTLPMPAGGFTFAAYNQAFLKARQGMSMLALQSGDAHRDYAEFVAKGLGTHPPFDFSRKAILPDGQQVTVSFTLTYVTDARMPTVVFFVIQHHTPQYFWKPDYQRHSNGATTVAEVIMVSEDPASLAEMFAKLHGSEAVAVAAGQLAVATQRGKITVLTPVRYAERFPAGKFPQAPATSYFAGYQVCVADLDRAKNLLKENAVAYSKNGGRIQIGPAEAFGTGIEFVAEPAP